MESGTNFVKSVLQCPYYFGLVCGCRSAAAEKGPKTMKTHLKISAKRICAVMLAVLVAASVFCIPAFAETEGTEFTIPQTAMTITVPEDVKILSLETTWDDPVWAELGILDTYSKGSEMLENNILAELYAFDQECVIAITKKESDFSESLYNLNNMEEKDKEEFLKGLVPFTADGSTKGSSEWYERHYFVL